MCIQYREPLFRPPAEANSLIFQLAYGCPTNSCRFCLMFKTVQYEIRPINEILTEIEKASQIYPEQKRFFLADANAMALPFDMLKKILTKLNQCFPNLARINSYANASSILAFSKDELTEFHNLKLNTLYLGLETGDQELLEKVSKKENVEDTINAVHLVQNLEMTASVMVLLGLAGKFGSEEHAMKTAEALNQMQPRLLSALRFIEFPGKTKMFDGYKSCTEYEVVSELHKLIKNLDLHKTVFTANHSSNPVPLTGRLAKDKNKIMTELDFLIKHGNLDKKGYGYLPPYL